MIQMQEVKKEMIQVIKNLYPKGYRFYGAEVTEGYEKPSFFTQILPEKMENETKNLRSNTLMFVVTYFQKAVDEADMLEKAREIRNAFGLKVKVDDRYINVIDFDYDFVGSDDNILQMRITVSFYEQIPREKKQYPAMGKVKVRLEE